MEKLSDAVLSSVFCFWLGSCEGSVSTSCYSKFIVGRADMGNLDYAHEGGKPQKRKI